MDKKPYIKLIGPEHGVTTGGLFFMPDKDAVWMICIRRNGTIEYNTNMYGYPKHSPADFQRELGEIISTLWSLGDFKIPYPFEKTWGYGN